MKILKPFFHFCFLLLLSHCASQEPKKVATPTPQPTAGPVAPPEIPHELGSVWSDNSRWNSFYAFQNTRVPGDAVLFKVGDSFRSMLMSKVIALGYPTNEQIMLEGLSPTIMGVITDAPRGNYSVKTEQSVKLGPTQYFVKISARVREQDVSLEDAANTEAMYDMVFDIKAIVPKSEKKKGAGGEEKDNADEKSDS